MRGRRRGIGGLCAVLALLGAGTTAAVALGQRAAAPVTVSVPDAVGDAVGSGPDMSSVSYTVSGDTLTLSATFSNRSATSPAESVQFDLETQNGQGELNVSAFSGDPADLAIWSGSDWVEQHQLGTGSWSGNTFSLAVSLSDLRDTVHQPVTPSIFIGALSVEQSGTQVSIFDRAPDQGWTVVPTDGSPATATTAPTTTSAAPAGSGSSPGATTPPAISQTVKRLAHGRIELTKLAVRLVPPRSTVAIQCTAGCTLSEQPRVSGGTAVSKRFVGVPFAHGATFVVRVLAPGGTGWWFRTTVVARSASGPATTSGHGCIEVGGRLGAGSEC